ncbi:nitric oxide reductase activation protein NorD [Methanococcoides sp. FTZ1]|uniref:nitric oxide reductase activation protein NorD n=1 Tax=Methanococcoides sp. FTZ1 TaxID=3439061 RepID=UPI003F863828
MSQDEGKPFHLKAIIEKLGSEGLLDGLSDVEVSGISDRFERLPVETLSSLIKDPSIIEEWMEMAVELRSLNPGAGKAFLESIGDLYSLMDRDMLDIWYPIAKDVAGRKWKVAVDFIEQTADVFSVLPEHQRKIILLRSKSFSDIDPHLFLTFFSIAPLVVAAISKSEFDEWVHIGKELADGDIETGDLFLKRTPKFIGRIDISELEEYMGMGKDLFSHEEHEAIITFYDSVLRGLEKDLRRYDREDTRHLIDIGVKLTHICWRCVESFFENAPEALTHLEGEEFEEWLSAGMSISRSSTFYGSNYYHSSLSVLKNTDRKYYSVIFSNAKLLGEKNSMLAGIYFSILSDVLLNIHPREIEKWVHTGLDVFEIDSESAFNLFRNSPSLLKDLDVTELDEWAKNGISILLSDRSGGRSYFSLRSKSATGFAEKLMSGVALKRVSKVLKYYSLGIAGVNFTIRSKSFFPGDFSMYPNPIVSGRTIYLEPTIKGYGDFEENFTIYKLSLMHEVGHIQFGTSSFGQGDVLSLLDKRGIRLSEFTNISEGRCDVPVSEASFFDISIIAAIIGKLPAPFIAADIMGIIEDARVEYMTTSLYRGIRREFEDVRTQMSQKRPVPISDISKFMESLLLTSVDVEPSFCIGEDLREILDRIREILVGHVFRPDSSTLDSIKATFDIYDMLTYRFCPLELLEYEPVRNFEYRGIGVGSVSITRSNNENFTEQVMESFIPRTTLPDDKELMEERSGKGPEYANSKNWEVLGSYSYDEWDSGIQDYKNDWCTVYEVSPSGSDNDFYLGSRAHYAREITQINRIFKMMKPESFRRLRRQLDGDDFDLDAMIEAFADRKSGINPTDRLYIRRDKRERDVATLFLLDISASTKKKLENGRRILDVEKDSLIIMTQALESIGDKYAIAAFSGNTRSDVEFYTIKEFDETFSQEAECRISALEPALNTRLGAAIRHSISKLKAVEAKVKLLVLLSDGDPYDLGFADGKYQGKIAIEDTRVAIQEGNALGMHFFCITVDSEGGEYLDSIFSDVGYTIIDNAATLPERLPMLYNRITT